jgi:hypothetical protein
MAKGSKKRKQGPEKSQPIPKKLKRDVVPTTVEVDPPNMIGNLLFLDELETTTETLTLLAQNPSLIGLKALKPFKTAVHDYWRVAHETTNTGEHPFIITLQWILILLDRKFIDVQDILCTC